VLETNWAANSYATRLLVLSEGSSFANLTRTSG
jgi:hypothetical protein